ncbi:TetR family transcriptional regulator|nr:TetR family transcriptional regulator [Candidatus Pantoea persica]
MLADIIGSGSATVKCCGYTRLHLDILKYLFAG